MSLFPVDEVWSDPLPSVLRGANGRLLHPTSAFRTYWRFAAERQCMFFRRLRGDHVLTADPILRGYRFTNVYRAADRVSQYLINQVQRASRDDVDLVFRTLLFKLFNSIDTWRILEHNLSESPHYDRFSVSGYDAVLSSIVDAGSPIYSGAYIMPNPPFGRPRKHSNHLLLIDALIKNKTIHALSRAQSLSELYTVLATCPSFGPFLAYQYAIDLNYGESFSFDEMEFIVAGPGARSGIAKCFADVSGYSAEDVIRIACDETNEQFSREGVVFHCLWGRPLRLIDCQNVFCEVDKYLRGIHPALVGPNGRTRIKQRYKPRREPLPAYDFPRAWRVDASGIPDVSLVAL